MTKFQKKLWMGIGILALLSPIGIILPEKFKAGDAWGEWGTDAIKEMLGYVPKGLEKLSELWKAPLPDYSFGGENAPQVVQYGGYIVSAIVGIVLVGGVLFVLKKTLLKHPRNEQ